MNAKNTRARVHPLNKPLILLQMREHDENRMRVWRTGWAGDQFEILTKKEVEQANSFLARFSLPLIEDVTGDDD